MIRAGSGRWRLLTFPSIVTSFPSTDFSKLITFVSTIFSKIDTFSSTLVILLLTDLCISYSFYGVASSSFSILYKFLIFGSRSFLLFSQKFLIFCSRSFLHIFNLGSGSFFSLRKYLHFSINAANTKFISIPLGVVGPVTHVPHRLRSRK